MKIILLALCVSSIVVADVVRIERIENYTQNGVFKIDLTEQKSIIVPSSSAVDLEDLLSYALRQRIDIACVQGDYDPIYIELHENAFACGAESNCMVIIAWLGPQTVFADRKNYITVCCEHEASFKLVIHVDGSVDIMPMKGARYF